MTDETFTVATMMRAVKASSVVAVDPKTVMVTITDADQKPEASFASVFILNLKKMT